MVPATVPVGGPPTETSAPSSRPKRLARRVDQPAGRARVGVVGHHGDGRVTEVGDGGVEGLGVAAGQHHPGAVGDERVGGGASEPAGASGDEVDTVRQLEVHGHRP